MVALSVNNLTYKVNDKTFFENFNLEIEENDYVSIIAPNQSGKTLLTKIICAIIPTHNVCYFYDLALNRKNVLSYIAKLGIVTNDFNQPFIFKKVIDELKYPLINLGYSDSKIQRTINKYAEYFEIENLLDKKINSLNTSEKSKLLIVIALIHEPKMLILDDAFSNMNKTDKLFMLKKLKELNEKKLTILNITSDMETIYDSKRVLVLNNFKIEADNSLEEILLNNSSLNKIGIELPFIIDLSLKLKYYNLIDKIYFNMDELEDNLWK